MLGGGAGAVTVERMTRDVTVPGVAARATPSSPWHDDHGAVTSVNDAERADRHG